jgi:hypothetical protein
MTSRRNFVQFEQIERKFTNTGYSESRVECRQKLGHSFSNQNCFPHEALMFHQKDPQ